MRWLHEWSAGVLDRCIQRFFDWLWSGTPMDDRHDFFDIGD